MAANHAIKGFPAVVEGLLEMTNSSVANTVRATAYINSAFNAKVYPEKPDSFVTGLEVCVESGSYPAEDSLRFGLFLLAQEVVFRRFGKINASV